MSTSIKRIYVDLAEVASILSLAISTVQRLVRESQFPQPRQLSRGRVAWLLREVEQWAEERPVSDIPPPSNTGARKGIKGVPRTPDADQGA